MKANDILQFNLSSAEWVWNELTGDLSNDDLFARITPTTNHLAWQWGHVLSAQRRMVESICPGAMPPLPAGFDEQHSKATAETNDRKGFLTKAQYAEIGRAQNAAAVAAFAKLTDAELSKPLEGPMKDFAPTGGSLMAVQGLHLMWHVGLLTALRRYLNKPVKF